MSLENCPHNVLVKQARPDEEIRYMCMRCGKLFEKPNEIIPKEKSK